jgi:Mg2+ and Co2+ transporter CorA
MTNAEPARHALYAELERVLGVEHADTLMTHLPQHTSDEAATKGEIALLGPRFDRIDDQFNRIEDRFDRMDDRFDRMEDRMEDRFNRMEDRMDKMQRNFLTVSFGTLTVMTAIFAFITRI